MREIRVRFAPSPTGPLHIGGVRTALYNYLFARQHAGVFILRIEDTDQGRFVPGAEQYILDSLRWCDLIPDEGPEQGGPFGPYRQSDRKEIYQAMVKNLITNGKAYYAFDTVEELEKMRSGGDHLKYDAITRLHMRNSLSLGESVSNQMIKDGQSFVIRLLVPDDRTIRFVDRIRGEVAFETRELDDKVLLKADGMPTYHLANVVDDYLMKISHVIRGEEWLSSTAHHVLLYEAFEWLDHMPEFAHLPLILKPDGKGKLSKRDGQKFGFPVFPLAWKDPDPQESFEGFQSMGFSPAALLNFLAFLGWNPGTEQEIFSMDELIEAFSLEHIGKSGARFDYEKALWFNGHYIAREPQEDLSEHVQKFLAEDDLKKITREQLGNLCTLVQDRIRTYREFRQNVNFFFKSPEEMENVPVGKKWSGGMGNLFKLLYDEVDLLYPFQKETIKVKFMTLINDTGQKPGDVFSMLRLAMSGESRGPDLFAMMEILGKEEVRRRLTWWTQFNEGQS